MNNGSVVTEGGPPRADAVRPVRVKLLGGFGVDRAGTAQSVSDWQRRSAKTLVKLLATSVEHRLHREQIVEILWPRAPVESALNSFGKALHAARRALEPELSRREDSAYLRLADGMLSLNPAGVLVDVDRFEQLAEVALQRRDAATYEAALAAYGGDLLPEDLYESWCADRRSGLAELRVQLLLGAAEAQLGQGTYEKSAGLLREVLRHEPAREAAHRKLMRLYTEMGTPEQAIRQFQLCRDILHRDLGLAPQQETVSLHEEAVSRRVLGPVPATDPPGQGPAGSVLPLPAEQDTPVRGVFVGRDRVLERLHEQLRPRDDGRAGLVVISGEAGVGKTRLLEEFARQAGEQGALTLWGGRGAHAGQFACGPFAVALEGYAERCTEAERQELAARYPALTRFVPSLGAVSGVTATAASRPDGHADVISAIARLFTDLSRVRPLLMVLGDLPGADPVSLDLVRYLAQLAVGRPWLMIGAVSDEELETDTELRRTTETMVRARLCLGIDLQCLSRRSCDQLVRAMLPPDRVRAGLLEQIYTRSRGNPLFVGELVRDLRSGSWPEWPPQPRAADRGAGLARAQMAMRLDTMDDIVRRVLGLAAAAGETEIPLTRLRMGAAALEPPVSSPALFDALDRALQMRLLEERTTGYAFRHPFVRSALFEALPRHRRDEFEAAISAAPGTGRVAAGVQSPVRQAG